MQREEQSGQDARGPQSGSEKVIFEVDVMCISTPRKRENETQRTAQSRDRDQVKGFGPAERIAEGYFRSRPHVRWRTPRKHENTTRRTAQSHGRDWAKGFGPAEGGFRGRASGRLSHSVCGVWEMKSPFQGR
ncbi:MAG: hypothetical protein J7M39_08910, partial [Anaerolineae bacterium]|nr:hypothetical protein [Anaerolineae bacterium]